MGYLFSRWTSGDGGKVWAEKIAKAKKRHGTTLSTLAQTMRANNGKLSGAGWDEALTLAAAVMGDPPADSVGREAWAKNVMLNAGQIASAEARERYKEKGGEWGKTNLKGAELEAYQREMQQEFGADPALIGQDFNDLSNSDAIKGVARQFAFSADEDPTLVGGSEPEGTSGDYEKRLQEFRDALYNKASAQRIGSIAAGQSARGAYAAGVRGPANVQGINQSVADAGFQYEQGINSQALQMMSMENQMDMTAAQLQQQAKIYNSQMMAANAQAAYNQRAQTGGMVGGIIGTGLGAVAQYYTGIPGLAQAGGQVGTGIGSGVGGGAAPSAGLSIGSGSIQGASRKKSGGGTGSLGNY